MSANNTAPDSVGELAHNPLAGFFGRLFRVQQGEWPKLLLAFFTFFLLLGTWFMLRPVRGTVAANNSELLPWLYTATFTTMLLAVPVFGYLVSRFPRKVFLPAVYLFFASNIVLFIFLFRGDDTNLWVQRGFYVWSSVFNLFIYSLFWSLMADIFRAGQATRLFGSIMAGGSLGAIVGPLITSQWVGDIGTKGIMMIALCAFLAAVGMIMALSHIYSGNQAQNGDGEAGENQVVGGTLFEGAVRVFTSKYLLFICLLMLAHNLTSTFLYNGLAILVDNEIIGPNSFDRRTEFFSYVDLIVQIIAFVFQFFITSRLLAWLGMGRSLIMIPLMLTAGMVILGSGLTLVLFAGVQILQRSMNYGLIGPAKEMLFTVVDRETKYKCKNFIDTVVYRGSDVTASWLVNILLKVGLSLSHIAWLFVPVMLMWSAAVWYLGGLYQKLKNEADEKAQSA